MRVALVGLGKMGVAMGKVLLQAGHELTVYNRTAEKARELAAKGAAVANSPAKAARNAEAVLTMVFDDAAMESVAFDAEGILAGLQEHAVHVGLSTISVAMARRLERGHQERNRAYVGAPVLGRPDAALQGKLVLMVGGESQAIGKVKPLFDVLGRATVVAGPQPWHANLFKLCSNFMISGMLEGFAEAQALVGKSGLAPADFVTLMAEFWGSPVYKNYGSMMAEGRYTPPGATLQLGLKDNRLLLEAAQEQTVPMPLASLVRDQMMAAIANGMGDMDWASVGETAMRNAGLRG